MSIMEATMHTAAASNDNAAGTKSASSSPRRSSRSSSGNQLLPEQAMAEVALLRDQLAAHAAELRRLRTDNQQMLWDRAAEESAEAKAKKKKPSGGCFGGAVVEALNAELEQAKQQIRKAVGARAATEKRLATITDAAMEAEDKYRRQLDAMRRVRSAALNQVAELQGEVEVVRGELALKDAQLAEAAEQLVARDATVEDLTGKLAALETKVKFILGGNESQSASGTIKAIRASPGKPGVSPAKGSPTKGSPTKAASPTPAPRARPAAASAAAKPAKAQ